MCVRFPCDTCGEPQRRQDWSPTCEEDEKVPSLRPRHLPVDPLQNVEVRTQLCLPLLLPPPLAALPLLRLCQPQVLLPRASWQLQVFVRGGEVLDLDRKRPPRNLQMRIKSLEQLGRYSLHSVLQ